MSTSIVSPFPSLSLVSSRNVTGSSLAGVSMMASNQWRTRPADEAFWDLDGLIQAAERMERASAERDIPTARLVAVEDDGEVKIIAPGYVSNPMSLTYHAFGQLAMTADGAPAWYLRTLTGQTAVECLTEGLARRARSMGDDARVSLYAYDATFGSREAFTARALNGEHYSRFLTAPFARMIRDYSHRSGRRFVTPPAWVGFGGQNDGSWKGETRIATPADCGPHTRVQPGDIIRPAGCYYGPSSGRDTFIFLVDTERAINLPGGGAGFRFLLFWNSETGASSVGCVMGIVDIVCGNHILWNARDVKEFRFRHIGDGLSTRTERELQTAFGILEKAPWEEERLNASARCLLGDTIEEAITRAAVLTKRPETTIAAAVKAVNPARNYGDPKSAYAIASALTEASQRLSHTAARVDLDRAASRLYSMAA